MTLDGCGIAARRRAGATGSAVGAAVAGAPREGVVGRKQGGRGGQEYCLSPVLPLDIGACQGRHSRSAQALEGGCDGARLVTWLGRLVVGCRLRHLRLHVTRPQAGPRDAAGRGSLALFYCVRVLQYINKAQTGCMPLEGECEGSDWLCW